MTAFVSNDINPKLCHALLESRDKLPDTDLAKASRAASASSGGVLSGWCRSAARLYARRSWSPLSSSPPQPPPRPRSVAPGFSGGRPAPATPLSHSASAVAPSAAPARRKSGGVCLEEARASGLRDGLRQLAQRASVQLLLRFRLSGPVLLTTSPARAARASCWHPSLRVSESLPWDPSLNRHQAPAQPQAETARLPRPRGVPEPG